MIPALKNPFWYIDAIFCAVILPVFSLLASSRLWRYAPVWLMLSLILWLYVVYFVNRQFTIPFLFSRKRIWPAGVLILALTVAGTYILALLECRYFECHGGPVHSMISYDPVRQNIWALFVIVTSFSCGIGVLNQYFRQVEQRRNAEAARRLAGIDLLKARTRPHFVFNTLNSLYGLFLTGSPKALPALERFISMSRYMHENADRQFITLGEEAEYLTRYIELQQLRMNPASAVIFNVDIEDKTYAIPPLLLTTYVENSFKHGYSPEEPSDIKISMIERGGMLTLSTFNRIFDKSDSAVHRHGSGHRICRERLELLYPGDFDYDIRSDGKTYSFTLTINLRHDKLCGN